jgi:predicted nucleotidyltransferase
MYGRYNARVNPSLLEDVARRHGILLLLQFGSTVSGRARAESDLDLAVLVERVPATLEEYADLSADLQSIAPDRRVDVAVINRADPLFLKQILEHCALLHGSLRRLHELKMYAFKRYQDHRRYLAMERDYVARTLRSAAP